jgi:Kef-type K+ transport system membrane component KefB
MTLVLVLLFASLMHATRTFGDSSGFSDSTAAQAFGFLMLVAFFVGGGLKRFGLPRLTGYIASGILFGPSVLGIVDARAVADLQITSGIAVALIALTAGVELEWHVMRPILRWILGVSVFGVLGTTVLLAGLVFVLKPQLPFVAELTGVRLVTVALLLGVVTVAQSPAVVVALRDELNADGPLTRTVLGTVVLADLGVIIMFAVASAAAKAAFGADAGLVATVALLGWELFGSMTAGVVIGAAIVFYLRRIGRSAPLFLLAVSFLVAEIGRRLHFDPLIVMLAAGVFVRNTSQVGDQLHREIETSSLPVYVVFFAVAGASIHIEALRSVGIPAAAFVVVRAIGFVAGSRIGGHLAKAPPEVSRYAGFGLMPQAGLALALSMLFAKAFPEFGKEASALTLSIVAINEIVAPALYRWALVRAGEAGTLDRAPDTTPPPAQVGEPSVYDH